MQNFARRIFVILSLAVGLVAVPYVGLSYYYSLSDFANYADTRTVELEPDRYVIPADGSTASMIDVTVLDEQDVGIENELVSFGTSLGSFTETGNNVRITSTDANGTASASLVSEEEGLAIVGVVAAEQSELVPILVTDADIGNFAFTGELLFVLLDDSGTTILTIVPGQNSKLGQGSQLQIPSDVVNNANAAVFQELGGPIQNVADLLKSSNSYAPVASFLLSLLDEDGNAVQGELDNPIIVQLVIDGLPEGVSFDSLELLYYDQVAEKWSSENVQLISSDPDTNTITFSVGHLSEWTLRGEVSGESDVYLPVIRRVSGASEE